MAKIKLNPDPTFTAPVSIPVHGKSPVAVKFTFKHRTKDAAQAWLEEIKDKSDVDVVMDCATAWELDDKFTAENVELLLQNYVGAGGAVVSTYLDELLAARAKN